MCPQVGKEVTIVVRNTGAHRRVFVPLWNDWTAPSPETLTYKGTVVKNNYWMNVDEFNMTTGQKDFPIRTIRLKNVLSIDGVKIDQRAAGGITTKTIKGSKGNQYTVTLNNGVAEKCTCPAFIYRGGQCKHLALASVC